ncbi:sensor histidine kinase [Paenibacillus hexagrammi]|uniref:histidine kinase n=1 Tax=Paenibacillus hexagrammi TaxID=2908839 RepID=A0ABY3SL24_9BACL|nr:sensor histidine kinase [Paenibacillus sp. YPD9-1]UJF34661.1 sensor histidine kinase [Paenibacillus sp. YPD9-1]
MWPRLNKWNTLRNQILVGFLLMMMIVLCLVGIITFNSVSTLLKNKAEKQIKQTAIQASGRLEALINQVDTLTTQAINDPIVQQLLLSELNGIQADIYQKQSLAQIANEIQGYSSGVTAVEVYNSDYIRLFPLDGQLLVNKVDTNWIAQANQEKGKLVWIGIDPKDSDSVLAIRRISLIDRWFSNGGYLLIRINRNYFEFSKILTDEQNHEAMLLVDQNYRPIVSDNQETDDIHTLMNSDEQTAMIDEEKYIVVKQPTTVTGWTLMILNPVDSITEGISVLRTAIIASGAVGFLLFLLMSFLLSTMITRPILKLIKAMRNTRQGVLTPNPITSYTIEINDLNYTYNQMVGNINHLIELVYEKEVMQSRTELKALQAQINPHFLYNTLEALYWSLQERDEEELAEYVVAMSDLFRYIIGNPSKDEWVTIGDELEHIERYLLIMQMRFGERLTWSLECLEEWKMVSIPKLLIQPLVENAIQHGLEGRTGQGTVSLSVTKCRDSEHVEIIIQDDGPGMDQETLDSLRASMKSGKVPSRKGNGMGLSNVAHRIRLYFAGTSPEEESLRIESCQGKGTKVSFVIPMNHGGKE